MKYLITLPAIYLSMLLLCLAQTGTAAAATYPVDTTLAGFALQTHVDSPTAQMLINDEFQTMPESLNTLRQSLHCENASALPPRPQLREISRQYSPDTAMAMLIQCLLQKPKVAFAQALLVSEIDKMRSPYPDQTQHTILNASKDRYSIVLVPGWGYLEPGNPTGADLSMPKTVMEAQGFTTYMTPLPSNPSVEEGAKVLGELLRRLLKQDKNIILVSASSGGPIVAETLATQGIADNDRLRGWLNICGVLHGSPVIDSLLFWPGTLIMRTIALFEGWNYRSLVSLSRARSVPRFAKFSPPPQMTIVNYIGTPFSAQISQYGGLFKTVLKRKGPNDGLTYITDALAPGHTILGIGSDHFVMEDPLIEEKTRALLPVLLQLMNKHQP